MDFLPRSDPGGGTSPTRGSGLRPHSAVLASMSGLEHRGAIAETQQRASRPRHEGALTSPKQASIHRAVRLAMVSYYYPPSIGGVERQTELWARELATRGHRVHVICAQQGGAPAHELQGSVEVERVAAGRGSRWRKMMTFLSATLAVLQRERRHLELVHVQQALYPAAAVSAFCRLWGLPCVVCNHGSGAFGAVQTMERLPLGPLGLRLISAFSTTVALSDEMVEELRAAGFHRVERIPNGIEIGPARQPAERAEARSRLGGAGALVLYVGRFDQEKGVDRLIEAWRQARPAARLWLVGDGPQRATLEASAQADPFCRETVRFWGPRQDVATFLTAADLFVLPSRSEGMSVALMEAMAAGLPVVATAVGGNREVLCRPELGWLVPEGSDRLGATIVAVLADEEEAKRRGEAARRHAETQFSVARVIDQYEALYHRLLQKRGAA